MQTILVTTILIFLQSLLNADAFLFVRNCCNSDAKLVTVKTFSHRRDVLASIQVIIGGVSGGVATTSFPDVAAAEAANEKEAQAKVEKQKHYLYDYEHRNRNKNKDALIRDDIWYFTGQNPPRKLDLSNLPPG